MIRFLYEKVLMSDRGRLLKNQLAIIREGDLSGPRIVTLNRRPIRSQAASEGDDFVLEDRTFRFNDGEAGVRNFESLIVPLPGRPEDFTGEVKRILLSLEIWDEPGGHRFNSDSDCEIWIVPSPPQLDIRLVEPLVTTQGTGIGGGGL